MGRAANARPEVGPWLERHLGSARTGGCCLGASARPACGPNRFRSRSLAPSDIYAVGVDGRGLRRLTRDGKSTDPPGPRTEESSPTCRQETATPSSTSPTRPRKPSALDAKRRRGRPSGLVARRTHARVLEQPERRVRVLGHERQRDRRPPCHSGSTRKDGSFYPAWSPDGERIAFASSSRTPKNQEIYVVRRDGSTLRRLTRTAGDIGALGDDAAPAWSPDGKRIVFASNRRVSSRSGRCERTAPLNDGWLAFAAATTAGQSTHRTGRGSRSARSTGGEGARSISHGATGAAFAGSSPAPRPPGDASPFERGRALRPRASSGSRRCRVRVSRRPLAERVELASTGGHVVQHEQATGLEQTEQASPSSSAPS